MTLIASLIQSTLHTPLETAILTSYTVSISLFVHDQNSYGYSFVIALKIYEKLNYKNFLVYHQQVELYINTHNLDDFLVLPLILSRFLTATDHTSGLLNPVNRQWRQKDLMLLSWLLFTLFSKVLACVIVCSHAY